MNSSVSEKTIINNIKIENKNSRKMVTNNYYEYFMINIENKNQRTYFVSDRIVIFYNDRNYLKQFLWTRSDLNRKPSSYELAASDQLSYESIHYKILK